MVDELLNDLSNKFTAVASEITAKSRASIRKCKDTILTQVMHKWMICQGASTIWKHPCDRSKLLATMRKPEHTGACVNLTSWYL